MARPALAQSGIQVTPDGKRTLVSKDLGGQRWAITRNPNGSVTGNVFSPSGGPPQFVWCSQTSSSNGVLGFSCSGSDACLLAPCEPDHWTFIADVTLPESFFAPQTDQSLAIASIFESSIPSSMIRLAAAPTAGVQGGGSSASAGLQITPDGARTLLSKDVGDQRWAISRNEDNSATGNVFFPGGGEPKFVWCEQTGEDPGTESVSLRCLGADPCPRDGSQACTGAGWTLIAEVSLPLSFFTPREVIDDVAFGERLVAELGDDGAFMAVARALERGYSLEQIIDAGLEKRLRPSGEIILRSGATEPPSGPALDLFTDEAAASSLADPSANGGVSLTDFLAQFKKDNEALGFRLVILLMFLIDSGYSAEQIVTELFFGSSKIDSIDSNHGKLGFVDENGKPVPPDGPPHFKINKCGNGVYDYGGETCEPGVGGPLRYCPDLIHFAVCTSACRYDNSQCPSSCNDGIITGNETCDGSDLGGKTCADFGGSAATVPACRDCQLDPAPCRAQCAAGGLCCENGEKPCANECIPQASACCGDGVRQGSEQCDGADLGGTTCASQGQGSGTLACSATCGYNTAGCTGGGTCPGETFACEGGCAPDGADCCEGKNGYCAPGNVCVGDDDCCVATHPVLCGSTCFAAGTSCCGTGTVEAGEVCDGAAGCGAGEVCSNDCKTCESTATCGNGIREGSEVCDKSAGCDAGELCADDCSVCNVVATCGNNVREAGEACDPPGATSGCGAGEVCGADCTSCVSTTSCAGRCCEGRNDDCTPPGVGCFCDDFCVEALDCCDDFFASCG